MWTLLTVCDTADVSYGPSLVASLQPSATVIVRDLGKLDTLIACTKYCAELCPELLGLKIAIVDDSWTAQAQQISRIKPDLVIAAIPYQEKAIGEIMKSGSRFLGLAPKSLADIYGDVAAIAGIMHVPEKGAEVIRAMQTQIESVRAKTSSLPKLKVFCEEWGKPLIASQPWVAELVEAAGGNFVGTPGAQIDPAAVGELQPDVLIAAWCGAGDRVPLEKIVRQRGWENFPAVHNRRVYCVSDAFLNTPAPTLLRGLHALVSAIHPEHFPQNAGLRCIETVE